jgi:adenylate cyclase
MNIRAKIILVVLPLIITPLLLTGVISALSAQNGITTVATGFLQFKSEQLLTYADSQWALIQENNLQDNAPFREAAESAVGAFARNLLRSPTELILAVDADGQVAMDTSAELVLSPADEETLRGLARSDRTGWQTLELGGAARVADVARFAPFGWTLVVSERRDAFYRSINEIITRTSLILSVSLAASIVLLLFFTGILTRPLRDMVAVMTGIISTGDLSRRVEVLYRDETGRLGHTFNLMTAELERAYEQIKGKTAEAIIAKTREQKTRTVFQKFVPAAVIDEFIARPAEMLEGQDRVLAVLISDIRSFTTISEKFRPDELVQLLNQYFSLMVEIVDRRNGIVDKYIGDAVMALFGAIVRREDDALQSVMAGLEMLDDLKDFNRIQQEHGRDPWQIGVGINYGPVTVGNIGSEKKLDFTVIGDAVNLAARLESLTKKYREALIVSEAVEYKVREKFHCRLLDKVAVKGRSRGVKIFAPYRKISADQEKAWKVYHDAAELYYGRRFDEAARGFRQALELLPGDAAATQFLTRCRTYISTPPPAGWEGVEEMTVK